jgi:SagB-type dehydrogenase family enzyme
VTELERVLWYHGRTKHHPSRYARSLGYLDWANQPDPFRRFEGAPWVKLPLGSREEVSRPAPLGRPSVARLLELSLAISAWKSLRATRWALRCNPSSGNLHPTEGYLLLPPVEGISTAAAVYHYRSLDHALERRTILSAEIWERLTAGLAPGSLFAALTSIHWRESWKYGERAFRYCQHDLGHALGALRYAAATLGWRLRLLSAAGDSELGELLGVDRASDFADAEPERPALIAQVVPTDGALAEPPPRWPPEGVARQVRDGPWKGKANRLSAEQVEWEAIEIAESATTKPAGLPALPASVETIPLPPLERLPSPRVILRRRSAVAFDGQTGISSETFLSMLDRCLPRSDAPPFDAIDWPPAVHLILFVHRVTGLEPGLYALPRDPLARERLATQMDGKLEWTRVRPTPEHVSLFLLRAGDMRGWGRSIACQQEIAEDGAFSLGMIAELDRCRTAGAWFYSRLFWETGLIGQTLYLEAESAGMRGTGIGCFFDDSMHELVGLRGPGLQDLYHFAVGFPVEDPRLTTLPPYEDAGSRR